MSKLADFGREPKATRITRDPELRAEFIELLKRGFNFRDIAKIMGVNYELASQTFRRLVWESAYQLAKEDEIAKLWTCLFALSQRLTDLEKKPSIY